MLDFGQGHRQIQHAKHEKGDIAMVFIGDPRRGNPACQGHPGFVQDLKQLVKNVALSFLSGKQVKQALAQHGEQTDIHKQLKDVDKKKQDGALGLKISATVCKLTYGCLTFLPILS